MASVTHYVARINWNFLKRIMKEMIDGDFYYVVVEGIIDDKYGIELKNYHGLPRQFSVVKVPKGVAIEDLFNMIEPPHAKRDADKIRARLLGKKAKS